MINNITNLDNYFYIYLLYYIDRLNIIMLYTLVND